MAETGYKPLPPWFHALDWEKAALETNSHKPKTTCPVARDSESSSRKNPGKTRLLFTGFGQSYHNATHLRPQPWLPPQQLLSHSRGSFNCNRFHFTIHRMRMFLKRYVCRSSVWPICLEIRRNSHFLGMPGWWRKWKSHLKDIFLVVPLLGTSFLAPWKFSRQAYALVLLTLFRCLVTGSPACSSFTIIDKSV